MVRHAQAFTNVDDISKQSFGCKKLKNGFEKSKHFEPYLSFSSDFLQSIKRQSMDRKHERSNLSDEKLKYDSQCLLFSELFMTKLVAFSASFDIRCGTMGFPALPRIIFNQFISATIPDKNS